MVFKNEYYNKVNSLTKLYNLVNSSIVLHEYLIGKFYFPSLVYFRDFTDKLFRIYKDQDNDALDSEFEKLQIILNKAGHESLYSILKKSVDEIYLVVKKYDYNVIKSVTSNYDGTKVLLNDAKEYVAKFAEDKNEIFNTSFEKTFNEFNNIPRFYDELTNKKHLLENAQKNKKKVKRVQNYIPSFQNLLIGVISTAVTFAFSFRKPAESEKSLIEELNNDIPTLSSLDESKNDSVTANICNAQDSIVDSSIN